MNQRTYDHLNDEDKLTFCTEMLEISSLELDEIPFILGENPMDCNNPVMACTLIKIIDAYLKRQDALMEKLDKKLADQMENLLKGT
jgi:hypothetical protein